MKNFYEYNLSDNLNKSLKGLRFNKPTEIQSKTIPIAINKQDILANAETGSGKTAAYLIPLIHQISTIGKVSGLILTPTRELAQQVSDVAKVLVGYKSNIDIALIVGGASMNNQLRQLKKRPKIIIGTPGRINDHLEKKSLNLSYFNFFVLDEADRMLDMGFEDQVERIIKFLPLKRQTLLFSATLPKEIIKLSSKYLHKPHRADVKENSVIKSQIKQKVVNTKTELKYDQLVNEITDRNGSILIFVKTKYSTEKLKKRLIKDTVKSSALHGNLRQNRRNRILEDFRKEKFRILIATDIASRGLDVPHIEHVINYDLPQVPEDFIHRIGRTARAGSVGEAVSFVTPNDTRMWKSIEKLLEKLKNPHKNNEYDNNNNNYSRPYSKKKNRTKSKSRKYFHSRVH
ncbi:MAG: ATP-dependent RNA helicase [Chloroflexi bacterium]|nr:ATP-dependent RNA helicase [Chloroflexota bacterium]|tara:strand:- start:1762 stop:2967 length:1206 start_codon:yes stop_codon:yes gene_type:complete